MYSFFDQRKEVYKKLVVDAEGKKLIGAVMVGSALMAVGGYTTAALAVHEPGRTFDQDVLEMTATARHTRHGAVTVADLLRDFVRQAVVRYPIDPERIVVLDSATACAGLGMLAMAASRETASAPAVMSA